MFIAWAGCTMTTLAGATAQRFLAGVESGRDEQALMQRATGNFKRGNGR